MNDYKFSVLLSASVPSNKRSKKYQVDYEKIKDAQIQIDEAVIGLSRNIFQAGGKIIFGGHPSISPLVAMVATEFRSNMDVEDPRRNEKNTKVISIYQSRAYKKVIPDDTTNLFKLGYSDIIWTEAVDGEEFDFNIKNKPQCEKSLEFMREQMMGNEVDALVCIGGMEGVELEFDIFRKLHPTKPIFVLQSTGGASKILARNYRDEKYIKVLDSESYSNLKAENKEELETEKFNIIPYSFITALIVKEILESKNG